MSVKALKTIKPMLKGPKALVLADLNDLYYAARDLDKLLTLSDVSNTATHPIAKKFKRTLFAAQLWESKST